MFNHKMTYFDPFDLPGSVTFAVMIYRAIGLMSGSSLDGLDIIFAELNQAASGWSFDILAADCYPYATVWTERLQSATTLNALEYGLLHTAYGRYLGEQVMDFMEAHNLHYKVALIASHGHTSFHLPARGFTAQLGDGAAIAAVTGLPVVSDLRSLDVAFGGQGAPIVPIAEKLLFKQYSLFLNMGGIANISINTPESSVAFDVCPANRVLNMLSNTVGKDYDAGGDMAATGKVNELLLDQLNAFPYYGQPYPKSLANSFGTEEIFPLIQSFDLDIYDALRTYVEHIVQQIKFSILSCGLPSAPYQLLLTGGGAFNTFLVQRLKDELKPLDITVTVPTDDMVKYKEALAMALIGVLRWRQEANVLSTVTGAQRDSIGGALWIGQEA